MAITPSPTSLRPPRAPYGGRLLGTDGINGANAQQYGNANMAGAIGNNLMGLLQGKNLAADQADRTNLTALAQLQKNQNAGLQRNAAQMGIQAGDPRYAAYQAKGQGEIQSMGSRLLGDAQQKRLDDQSRSLNTAVAFNQGQQNYGLDLGRFGLDTEKFGEDTRRYEQDFGENARRYNQNFGEDARRYNQDFSAKEKASEIGTLFDIINNPLSSEGQVEAAKQRLYWAQGGLDASTWGAAEKNNAQRQFDEIRNYLAVMNPGMSPEELDNLARSRMGTLDEATFGALGRSVETDVNSAKGNASEESSSSRGMGDRLLGGAVGAGQAVLSPVTAINAGLGNAVGESYRGVRDIGRGNVIGGAGRVVAAPFRGATHGALTLGRQTGSGLGKIFRAFG